MPAFVRPLIRSLLGAVLLLLVSSTVAFTQELQSTEPTDQQNEMRMYALMEPPAAYPGPLGRALARMSPIRDSRPGGRPMMVWYHWANQRKPFRFAFPIILFIAVVISSLAPAWIARAQAECQTRFWRTFLFGIVAISVGVASVRLALLTMIGWPLAILLMGLVQLSVAGGLAVITLLLGQAIGYWFKLDKLVPRQDVRRLLCILIGSLVIAALLQIPGIAILPRIGTRLVVLLAIVGLGALFRTRVSPVGIHENR